jgi:hypothetical protein
MGENPDTPDTQTDNDAADGELQAELDRVRSERDTLRTAATDLVNASVPALQWLEKEHVEMKDSAAMRNFRNAIASAQTVTGQRS